MPQKPLASHTSFPLGFFGKIPAVGDFVHRNLSVVFVDKWDHWLQNGLYRTGQELGESWPEIYLTSPIWRFVLSPGVVDGHSYVGIMLPSIDSAGRYFPLTVVAPISPNHVARVWSPDANHWFDALEALMLSALEESLSLEDFHQKLQALPASWAERAMQSGSSQDSFVCIELDHVYAAPTVLAGLWAEQLVAQGRPRSFWWTAGSDRVSPALLINHDLPDTHHFPSLFNGQWEDRQWSVESWQKENPGDPPITALSDSSETDSLPVGLNDEGSALEQLLVSPPLQAAVGHTQSVGFTHPGNVRDINQDASIELSDAGVWVVADGMGGHLDGEKASQLIIEAVSWVTPRLGLEATTDEISLRLANVNQTLINERHGDSREESICGSTVVALIIKKNHFSCVWAGDSRLYLLRDGILRAVTQDHSLQEERGEAAPRNIITRAVGATPELELDLISEALQIGDRLMLCSDGVYGELSPEEISAALSADSLEKAISNISECVLSKAARDNLTAVLVDYN